MVKKHRAINTFSVIFFELSTGSLVNSGGIQITCKSINQDDYVAEVRVDDILTGIQ